MLRKSGVGDNRLVRSEGIGTSGCGGGRIDLGLPEARVGVSWATPRGSRPEKMGDGRDGVEGRRVFRLRSAAPPFAQEDRI